MILISLFIPIFIREKKSKQIPFVLCKAFLGKAIFSSSHTYIYWRCTPCEYIASLFITIFSTICSSFSIRSSKFSINIVPKSVSQFFIRCLIWVKSFVQPCYIITIILIFFLTILKIIRRYIQWRGYSKETFYFTFNHSFNSMFDGVYLPLRNLFRLEPSSHFQLLHPLHDEPITKAPAPDGESNVTSS